MASRSAVTTVARIVTTRAGRRRAETRSTPRNGAVTDIRLWVGPEIARERPIARCRAGGHGNRGQHAEQGRDHPDPPERAAAPDATFGERNAHDPTP